MNIRVYRNIDIGDFLDNIFATFARYDDDDVLNHVLNESLQSYNCFERKPVTLLSKDIAKNINELCTICQYDTKPDEDVIMTECKHFFHKDCIDEWIKFKAECPVCKMEIKVTKIIT
jgi:hypothetical protein